MKNLFRWPVKNSCPWNLCLHTFLLSFIIFIFLINSNLVDTTAATLLPTRSPRTTTTDTMPDTTRGTDSTTEDTDTTDTDSTTADTDTPDVDTDTTRDTPPRRPAEATALSTPTSMVWTSPWADPTRSPEPTQSTTADTDMPDATTDTDITARAVSTIASTQSFHLDFSISASPIH